MSYLKSQMLYGDTYYKWTARDDSDNPYYTGGTDRSELNRTEGYEILYFINHLANKRLSPNNRVVEVYRKIEKMIRYDVPTNIRKREEIESWIMKHI